VIPQLIPTVSPTNPITTVIPLVGVLTLTAVKEAYEDFVCGLWYSYVAMCLLLCRGRNGIGRISLSISNWFGCCRAPKAGFSCSGRNSMFVYLLFAILL
jgi:hypothetical protein